MSIIVVHEGEFKLVGVAGDDGDGPIQGGQSYIITASEASSTETTGDAWHTVPDSPPAPSVAVVGYQVGAQTPVLEVHGGVIDEEKKLAKDGLRLTVKNLSTGASLNTLLGDETLKDSYSVTFVDVVSSHAARVGDVLEITVEAHNSWIRVRPLRHIVSTDDVKMSQIRLPDLVAYEIPGRTELLINYPNPFNPETWIPFRLSEDAFVKLTIYDVTGTLIRSIDVGHKPAAVYESKNKAIYWNGRNDSGELVSSGTYFYHLRAGAYAETKKMVILK